MEENFVVSAIKSVLMSSLRSNKEYNSLRALLHDVFPHAQQPKSGHDIYDSRLVDAIESQLRQHGLQVTEDQVQKVIIEFIVYTINI